MKRASISLVVVLTGVFLLQLVGLAQQGNVAGRSDFVAGELLVKFNAGPDSVVAKAAHSRVRAKVLRAFRTIGWQQVRLPAGMTTTEGIARYKGCAGVIGVEPNSLYYTTATPNDPSFSQQWGPAKIGAPSAWDTTTGSNNVIVAVIDSGVDYQHEDLAANMWQNPGEIPGNGLDDDGNGYADDVYGIDAVNDDSDPMDDLGHGTHVAGIIGAVGNNGTGVVGVNWSVRIMALKFNKPILGGATGSGSTADAITCFEYAIMMKNRGVNIRVTSNSWGNGIYSQALKDVMDQAGGLGILHCCAAGNGGLDGKGDNNDVHNLLQQTPEYPASYTSASIISVASSDENDNRASFSNYGPTSVDLAAPGVDILSTIPNSTYEMESGTSMATPFVTGSAALVSAADSGLSAASVKSALLDNVDVFPQWTGKVVSNGRLNIARAVQSAGGGGVSITLSAPNGGEILQGGATYEIQWSSAGDISHVGLSYSTDGGQSFPNTIAHPTDNDGSYTWTVPSINSTTVRVRIEAMDSNHNMLAQDDSDASFTITTGGHDVAVTALGASPNPISRGQRITFSYSVKNQGTSTESGLTFSVSQNGQVIGKPQSVGTLSPGATKTGTIRFRVPRSTATGDYIITGEVSTVPGDTNTDNNRLTVKVTVK